MKPIVAETCTEAWLEACEHLITQSELRDYSLILEVENPMKLSSREREMYGVVDSFLKENGAHSINTVVNTIFPASLYRRHGSESVLDSYRRISKDISAHEDCKWGTYAIRMAGFREDKYGKKYSPLEALIEKMKNELSSRSTKRAVYELGLLDPVLDLPLYDGDKDYKYRMGGPCLSHLSFKIKPGGKLLLVAVYRSHYYMQRALGNLFGLAWLQRFVAEQVGLEPGELVCVSTMATLDLDKGWNKTALSALLVQCRELLSQTSEGLEVSAV